MSGWRVMERERRLLSSWLLSLLLGGVVVMIPVV